MNRLDKIVTFQPLGSAELKKILDIELNLVQQRIFNTSNDRAFVFTVSDSSKDFLLEEGTDLKYGARHLKRAIERLLVQPMANLIATDQVRGGDWIRVDYDDSACALRFAREAEGLPVTGYGAFGGYFGRHSCSRVHQRRRSGDPEDASREDLQAQLQLIRAIEHAANSATRAKRVSENSSEEDESAAHQLQAF